jgi:uncharacterized protein (DUF362 family)
MSKRRGDTKRCLPIAVLLLAGVGSGAACTAERAGGSGGGGGTGSGGNGTGGASVGTGGRGAGGAVATGDGGGSGSGGSGSGGGGSGGNDGRYVVAMLQSSKAQAADITQDDVRALVGDAVAQAGGLGFIKDRDTVVLKPNLLTTSAGNTTLAPEVNGVTTDWRVTRAVAELVRARNPTGKIIVMEGSVAPTRQAFTQLGYTAANFGSYVDELIPIEGTSCTDRSTDALVQKAAPSGKLYWVNKRYVAADVVISLPTMKTHSQAGITGAVKNLGIGTTPVGQYSTGTNANDCTRTQTAGYIDHTREPLAQFIHDNYSIRPADFVVMDALQAIQHGPNPAWVAGGNYATDRMNMRLILAGRNAVAVDTIATLAMRCDPKQIGYLTKLETSGLGTTDAAKIQVVGKQVADVSKPFAGPSWACPGQ